MSTPKVLSRKANGVTAAQSSNDAPRAPRTKPVPEGEKVCIRHLPPGLTEDEFWAILGDTWKPGNGKVDWLSYWKGSVSQHPSKPSRPSRADLHITKRDELLALSEAVRTAEWTDAKNTFNDPALISAPIVQFSMYKKVPSDKKRTDSRQGTIDQDPDFMAFLENLANPDANKEAEPVDQAAEETTKGERPTTTPLIEHLREKAAKAKEVAAAKAKHSRQDSQGGKGKVLAGSSEEPKKKSKDKSEKTSDKAAGKASERPKESVKILSKKAATDAAVEAAKTAASQIQVAAQSNTQPSTSEAPPRSRRAGIAAAARILQRDLGLSPGNAHRKARQEAAKADAEAKSSASKEAPAESTLVVQESTPPSTPVEPSASSSAIPKAQAAASSRRGRGRNRGAAEDGAKPKGDSKSDAKAEKAAEPSSSAPSKAPVILKRRDEKKDISTAAPSPSASPAPTASSSTPAPPSGPKTAPAKQTSSKKGGGPATPTPGSTRAFIKHAIHSQGVTESALKEAMQAFGTVSAVEMDRKKGFAYVDFADHQGLVKAMAASPVTIAQGSVQVLERKEVAGKKKDTGMEPAKDTGKVAAPAESSTAAAAAQAPVTASTGASADKTSGEKHRGGRRRGGRGRGDKESGVKEGSSAGGGEKRTDAQESAGATQS